MKSYSSFLVRCWLIPDESDGQQRSLFDIEHIQTGEHRRIAALTEVQDWMLAACRNAKPASDDLQETEKPNSLLPPQR